MNKQNSTGIALAGCKIVEMKKRSNIMLNYIKNMFVKDELVSVKTVKRTAETRGRKTLSKKQKVLNLLLKGQNVAWSTIQSKFDLESPRAMIDTLRAEGYMIYGNRVGGRKYYRLGTPTRAIIAAGIKALYGTKFKYNNHKVSVRKSELAPIDA
jgi:hypothetical protein